jgi:CRP-like cAMP-binding protein
MEMGADDYVTKPFDDIELLNAVEARIKKNEVFKKEFSRNVEGLNDFLKKAKGMDELKSISTDKKLHNYKKKDMIYMEGDEPNGIIYINSGKIKTYKTNDQGKEFITGIHGEGEFIGYLDVFENNEYRETAEALEDSSTCIIPTEDFFALILSNRDVAAKFIKMLSNNIVEMEERLLNLAYNSLRKRVADALLSLHGRAAKAEQKHFSISREDLANIVGTATESVIRTLSDFKDEKLISVERGQITVLNEEHLRRMKN